MNNKIATVGVGVALIAGGWVANAQLTPVDVKKIPPLQYEMVNGKLKETRVQVMERLQDKSEKIEELTQEIGFLTEERDRLNEQIASLEAELNQIQSLR